MGRSTIPTSRGPWILPNISRDDPLFPKRHYWRGKVWAPINWLVYQGSKTYDWEREARPAGSLQRQMFLRPWRSLRPRT